MNKPQTSAGAGAGGLSRAGGTEGAGRKGRYPAAISRGASYLRSDAAIWALALALYGVLFWYGMPDLAAWSTPPMIGGQP